MHYLNHAHIGEIVGAITTPQNQKQEPYTISRHLEFSGCNFGWVSKNLPLRFGDVLDLKTDLDYSLSGEFFENLSFRELLERLGGREKILQLPLALSDVFFIIESHVYGTDNILIEDGTPNIFLVEGFLLQQREINGRPSFCRTNSREVHPVFVSAYDSEDLNSKKWAVWSHDPNDSSVLNGRINLVIPNQIVL